jgi:putative (di)nucleoside polyphosphate hydrolase
MAYNPKLPYRPCAGIMLFNKEGRVLVGQRLDTYLNAWQLPQGGINEGEEPHTAALRELEEEIGTANVEIIGEIDEWLNYDLPPELLGQLWKGRFQGQTQKWFAMRFLGDDIEINPTGVKNPEFNSWKWSRIEQIQEMALHFKQAIYCKVVSEFTRFSKEIK